MTYLDLLDDMCIDCKSFPCKNMRNCHSYKGLQDLIDKAEKYRWHDLRKNPNDLPASDDNEYWCIEKDGNYAVGNRQFVTLYCVAWREIKPFEEVAE